MSDVRIITDELEARLLRPEPGSVVRIGLVAPRTGARGLLGPATLKCAELAAAEINAHRGVLDRPIEIVVIDSGGTPDRGAHRVSGLVDEAGLDAVVGMHSSGHRVHLVRALRGRLPYVFVPPYEGGETAAGTFMVGETPQRQVLPALHRLSAIHRIKRWALIGDDHVGPRGINRIARQSLTDAGRTVVAERYVAEGGGGDPDLVTLLESSCAEGVLLSLTGSDLVHFNRNLIARGVALPRLCVALEENTVLAIGGDPTGELYSVMGYFATVPDTGRGFAERYADRFGPHAPVAGGHAAATYDAVHLLAALASRSGSLRPADLDAVADGTTITGARGRLTLRQRHLNPSVYLARVDWMDLTVLQQL